MVAPPAARPLIEPKLSASTPITTLWCTRDESLMLIWLKPWTFVTVTSAAILRASLIVTVSWPSWPSSVTGLTVRRSVTLSAPAPDRITMPLVIWESRKLTPLTTVLPATWSRVIRLPESSPTTRSCPPTRPEDTVGTSRVSRCSRPRRARAGRRETGRDFGCKKRSNQDRAMSRNLQGVKEQRHPTRMPLDPGGRPGLFRRTDLSRLIAARFVHPPREA